MNVGKRFEDDFKKSIPDYALCIRLRDEPQAFKKTARFSHKQPFDFIVFDGKRGIFCAFELKTTKGTSFSFDNIFHEKNEDKESNLIHRHQIMGLGKIKKYNNVKSGFLLNYRNEKEMTQETFYIDIKDFVNMCSTLEKKSCNKEDIIRFGGILVEGIKKKTRYSWNIDKLLDMFGGI